MYGFGTALTVRAVSSLTSLRSHPPRRAHLEDGKVVAGAVAHRRADDVLVDLGGVGDGADHPNPAGKLLVVQGQADGQLHVGGRDGGQLDLAPPRRMSK